MLVARPLGVRSGPFDLDLRSLALLRVALGVIVLADLAVRATDLRAHYTAAGVLPAAALPGLVQGFPPWAVPWLPDSPAPLAAGFAASAAAAVCLIVGWHTRLATALVWLAMLWIQRRNPWVNNAGDSLLRLLLFFGMLLPLGARASLDSRRVRADGPRTDTLRSLPAAALVLQVCLVYWCTAILKSDPIWRREGSALFYALHIDQLATPLAAWLLAWPAVLVPLSLAVYWLEVLGPTLVLVPCGALRTLLVSVFVGLHAGFGAFLAIGLFPAISAAGWLALLPGWFWERLPRRSGAFDVVAAPARSGLAPSLVAAYALAGVLAWNLGTLVALEGRLAPLRGFASLAGLAGLEQRWDMFAPFPLVRDGWWLIPGRLADGSDVDLFRSGAPLVWDKPRNVAAQYRNERWRKYMMNLQDDALHPQRLLFAHWLCAEWNAAHPPAQGLEALRLVFVREDTLRGQRVAASRPTLLLEHLCDGPTGAGE